MITFNIRIQIFLYYKSIYEGLHIYHFAVTRHSELYSSRNS